MKTLILAAGYGTRLYPFIKDTPKALLAVNGRPIVSHILGKVAAVPGLNEVLLVTNDKFAVTFGKWAAQVECPCPVKVINDGTKTPEGRLGSIGDIDFVLKEGVVNDDLLVVGGDNLFNFDLAKYIAFAKEKAPSVTIGVYDIGDRVEAKNFGVVELDGQKQIVSFEEKPAAPKSSLVAMCFYYLPEKSLGLIGDYLVESRATDRAGDYIRWLSRKQSVFGYKFTGKWYDIGSLPAYKEAQKDFKV